MDGTVRTARATRDAILSGTTSAEAVCQAALERIAAIDGTLHAFQLVAGERAMARARELDRRDTPAGPLHDRADGLDGDGYRPGGT